MNEHLFILSKVICVVFVTILSCSSFRVKLWMCLVELYNETYQSYESIGHWLTEIKSYIQHKICT